MRLLHRASLVFLLTDIFSKEPIRNAVIRCNGKQNPYILKDDGHYVFLNLYPGDYLISIRCRGYNNLTIPLTIRDNETKIITTDLAYSLGNPRLARIKKFIFNVTIDGKPLKNEDVIIKLDNKLKFLKLENPIEANQYNAVVNLGMNQAFMLQNYIYKLKNKEYKMFFTGYDSTTNSYVLDKPVRKKIDIGGEFQPFWIVKTNNKGQVMLPLMKQFMRKSLIEFEIRYNNKRAKMSIDLEDADRYQYTFYLDAPLEDYVEPVQNEDEDTDNITDENSDNAELNEDKSLNDEELDEDDENLSESEDETLDDEALDEDDIDTTSDDSSNDDEDDENFDDEE